MNERIQELYNKAWLKVDPLNPQETFTNAFAELIVKDCMTIARNWEDELERSKMPSESAAVGIVTYRISRQFGVEE